MRERSKETLSVTEDQPPLWCGRCQATSHIAQRGNDIDGGAHHSNDVDYHT